MMIIELWALDFYEVIVDEAEFFLKLTSNNSVQWFLDVLLNLATEKDRSDWIVI